MSNIYRGPIFKRLFIVISILVICFVLSMAFSSCNTSKQSNKHFYKAMNLDAPLTGKNCSISFPPITATKDSFVYIQGEDVVTHDTVQGNEYLVVGDTVIKYKYITKTVKSVDTFYRSSDDTQVDRGKETYLQDQNEKNIATISKQKKALSISLWAIVILGTYTLGRWVLRIWNIKLP